MSAHEQSLSTIALIAAVLVGCGDPSLDVTGHYESVSESEWSLDLYLKDDGLARILLQSWEVGSADRYTTEFVGTWLISGDQITLVYDETTERLQFSKDQSFREFGCNGHAPGVRGIRSNTENSLFEQTSLWRSEALRAIPDPC